MVTIDDLRKVCKDIDDDTAQQVIEIMSKNAPISNKLPTFANYYNNNKYKDMESKQIYHVIFDNRNYYFGSIAAIYDVFTPETLGVSKSRLWNFKITPEHPYKNKRCTINKGTIIRKSINK